MVKLLKEDQLSGEIFKNLSVCQFVKIRSVHKKKGGDF